MKSATNAERSEVFVILSKY